MQALYQRINSLFPLGAMDSRRDNQAFVTLDRELLRPVVRHLRDQEGFSHLVLLTAVDWLEHEEFQLTYLLHNRSLAQDIGLRVRIPREAASMDSIHDLWPTAATYQRELKEMFGIDFPGSPRVDEPFILEGWADIPPYRRDFDTLRYAEQTYRQREGRETKDPAQHMKQKLYPGGL